MVKRSMGQVEFNRKLMQFFKAKLHELYNIRHIYKNLPSGNAISLNTASQNLAHCNLQLTIISSVSCYTSCPKKTILLNSHTNC